MDQIRFIQVMKMMNFVQSNKKKSKNSKSSGTVRLVLIKFSWIRFEIGLKFDSFTVRKT